MRIPLRHLGFLSAFLMIGAIAATSLLLFPPQPGPRTGESGLRQKVSASSNLRMSFPEPMDQRSVEEHLLIPSDLSGEIQWEGDVLVFNPKGKLPPDEEFVFHLTHRARKADGNPLGRDLDFRFHVSGAPALSAHFPAANASGVPQDTTITLVFDRPMIALSQVQGEASQQKLKDWPVTISPPLKGRWRWISTVALEFIPEEGLSPSQRFTISVPPGIRTPSGEATEKDFTWTFETERPRLIASSPKEGFTLAGPNTPLMLTFSTEVDLASARERIALLWEGHRGSGALVPVPVKGMRYGTKSVNRKRLENRTVIIVTPLSSLAFEASYILKVERGLRSTGGDLGSKDENLVRFKTVGPLKVQSVRQEYGTTITFSNPMATGALLGNITLEPEPKNRKDISWSVNDWGDLREVSSHPELEPSTRYTLTMRTGVEDIFGQHLEKPFMYTFETPPLPPRVFIHSRGEFGIFERGKPPVYYLNAVNVSRLDLDLAPVPFETFLDIRRQKASDWNFQPDPSSWPARRSLTIMPPKGIRNSWESIPFDVGAQHGQTLRSGLYALMLRAPEYVQPETRVQIREQQYFALTNMTIMLKYSRSSALVWVTDMVTGNPVPDALLRFHALDASVKLQGRTDGDGFFEAPMRLKDFVIDQNTWQPEFWVTAEKGDDFAFVGSHWNDGIQAWDFDLWSDVRPADAPDLQLRSFLYTDRPVYGAGDTVHFKGIVRLQGESGRLQLPGSGQTALVLVQDSRGNEIYSKALPLTPLGGVSDSLPLSPDAALGEYMLSLRLQPEDQVQGEETRSFSVLAYRKPEYRVELTPDRDEYLDGQTMTIEVSGAYYFGVPMAGSLVRWRARTTEYFFNKFTDGWYSFALEEDWCWMHCERETEPLTEGEGTLDASGRLTLKLPLDLQKKKVSQIMTVEADITDRNNQVVSNRVSAPVHKSAVYVGARTRDHVVTPGTPARIDVITLTTEGRPLARQTVDVELFSRVWNSIRKQGVDGEYYEDNEPVDTFVRKAQVTTGADGKATAELLVDGGGEYRAMATARDGEGRTAKAGTSLYAWSSTYVNWPHLNNDRIDIEADKPEYAVGDKAKLLVKSPFQGKGVKALVTVERENVLARSVIDVESNAQPIEVPVTEDLIPNAFVSVVIIKPRIGETFNENGLDTGAPAFRIGYAKINVERKRKQLRIELSTDKERYLPGETVQLKIRSLDASGKPVSSELSLGVVDMSVLALTGFTMPDLLSAFYSERGLGVQTAEMLRLLLERFKPGSKGGGGANLEERKRGDFRDTAFWNPSIVTNASGEAALSFKLPDNLTIWQLLAIGSTQDHRFGAGKREITVTKRVILRPVRPRFAVRGDEVELGAIVGRTPGTAETFTVKLTGSGFTHLGKPVQTVRMTNTEQKKLTFPVRIGEGGAVLLRFSAESPSGRDEIEERIPVEAFAVPQTVATAGVTEREATEAVIAPSLEDARDGALTIALAPTVAAYLPGGLQYLATFPYGCAEQVMSSFLPSVALAHLQGFDAFAIVDRNSLSTAVTTGLQRLYAMQRGDGGFGFWSESTESVPYLTAYILHGLHLTKSAGYAVDEHAMDRAKEYLQGVLRNQKLTSRLDLATRAYILFVLAETGSRDGNLLRNLYEKRSDLPLFSRAHLAMALEDVDPAKANALLTEILEKAQVSARGTHFEEKKRGIFDSLMQTNTRTTATVLEALVRLQPRHTLAPNIVRYLLAVRRNGHWDTTQSTAVTILALTEYLRQTKELDASFRVRADVNGKTIVEGTFSRQNILTRKEATLALSALLREKENTVRITKEGTGRVYYDLTLSYDYTPDKILPVEEGMSIRREMVPWEGKDATVSAGKTFRVILTMSVPEDRHFVAVESPLPAGLEAIDPQFQTSQQLLEEGTEEEQEEKPSLPFSHREFRHDRVFLFADSLPAGVYRYEYFVRATTPGKFRERPARIWEMYFPEVFGQSEGGWFTVGP